MQGLIKDGEEMNQKFAYLLAEVEEGAINVFGSKAVNLRTVVNKGLAVPDCIVISSKALDYIVNYNGFAERFQQILLSGKMNKFNIIREEIKSFTIPVELVNDLEVKLRDLKFPVAVRSSSSVEDSEEKSCAGFFKSILDVKNFHDVQAALLDVWASAYTNLVDEPSPMGIIIQEYVDADYSGVVFTIDPISNEDNIFVEFDDGVGEKIVSGNAEAKSIAISRNSLNSNKIEALNFKDNNILKQLINDSLYIEKCFGKPMDIEWAVKDYKLYILQARPITTFNLRVFPEHLLYVSADNNEELKKYNLSTVVEKHIRWMDKKYWVRKYALENNIRIPKAGYLFLRSNKLVEKDINKILFESRIIKVVTDEKIRTFGRSRLFDYLKKILDINYNITVRIEEVTMTERCGNSCKLNDGNIYIETIPGGFGGFMFGNLPFSWYIINPQGEIIKKNIKSYTNIWKYNEEVGKFKSADVLPISGELNDSVIKEIIHISEKIDNRFKGARIEWEMEDDRVYLNDLSLENHSISSEMVGSKILSLGEAEGHIVIIKDIEELQNISSGRSVIAEAEFLLAKKSLELSEFASKLWNGIDKPILVTPYPHPSLALLTDVCAGFIFEQGAVLSHLGIILREEKIPAVIIQGACEKFKDNEFIQFENNKIRKLDFYKN